jgi:hypothetical protein
MGGVACHRVIIIAPICPTTMIDGIGPTGGTSTPGTTGTLAAGGMPRRGGPTPTTISIDLIVTRPAPIPCMAPSGTSTVGDARGRRPLVVRDTEAI